MSAASRPEPADWEVVIGLEVHVQLRTATKLFCGCAVSYGDPPNHHVCPVCLALPGALPVPNEAAVEQAVRAALAAHCRVASRSVFARKNYFYPDLPKGYQISQYEQPLAEGGRLEIPVDGDDGGPATRRIGITRIHMEEDAGKSVHEGAAAETHVDLNRAGVPLAEVVSEPDLRSAEEAGAYLRTLRALLRWVGASDANMEQGQFRCDANVSLRRPGDTALGTRTEIKNLNSFRFVEEAIRAETRRQAALLEEGEAVVQATLGYDAERGRLFVMRVKENADDYRYFPDPDLVPLQVPEERVEALREALPELPEARRARLEREHGLTPGDAALLTSSRALADFFEAAARAHGAGRPVANWVLRDLLAVLKESERDVEDVALAPEAFGRLLVMVDEGRVTAKSARGLLPELVERGGDPEALVRERGLEAVSDTGLLEGLVDEVLAAHPKAAESFAAGDTKAVNFLMGQVMRRTRGKADPGTVRALLVRKLEG
ncbi:MAG: Asp-tRNA(Asn)/Glu-tRNA(Gln) amidotransferase subunit GatB [Myxococcota bacterium]|nr:Asp-tRNA(Asn)/Glu-tRNA(Gln) amidotransferase subunit GatB [Myxococcota bacterium]